MIGDKLDELQILTEALSHDDSSKYVHIGQGNIIANEGGIRRIMCRVVRITGWSTTPECITRVLRVRS